MKWFEIFRAGKHADSNGVEREFTQAELDKIVGQYDPAAHEAPIVIGHPATDAPAYGWIEKVKRVGDKLLALPRQLQPEFIEAVNSGLFKKRSIALYPDMSLRHVGFLGAVPPAVKGLADLKFEQNDEQLVVESDEYEDEDDAVSIDAAPVVNELGAGANPAPQFDELRIKSEELRIEQAAKNDIEMKFAQSEEQRLKIETELERLRMQMRLTEFKTYFNEKLLYGTLVPAQENAVMKILEALATIELSEGLYEFADASKANPVDLFRQLIDGLPKRVEFAEIRDQGSGIRDASTGLSASQGSGIRDQGDGLDTRRAAEIIRGAMIK